MSDPIHRIWYPLFDQPVTITLSREQLQCVQDVLRGEPECVPGWGAHFAAEIEREYENAYVALMHATPFAQTNAFVREVYKEAKAEGVTAQERAAYRYEQAVLEGRRAYAAYVAARDAFDASLAETGEARSRASAVGLSRDELDAIAENAHEEQDNA